MVRKKVVCLLTDYTKCSKISGYGFAIILLNSRKCGISHE